MHREPIMPMVVIVVLVLACAFGISWVGASWEASTYNRLCQPEREATTWDAFTVELRVDTCNRREE